MKKLFLLFLLSLVSISAASAEELVFDGWIYHNKSFNVGEDTYKTFISSNENILLLSDKSINLQLNSCSREEIIKFCYNESVYDFDIEEYKARIYVYYVQPEIIITRSVNDNVLSVGEEATFTVNITNTGDLRAEGVLFTEDFPSGVEIKSVKSAERIGNSVYWRGDLATGKSRIIKYDVKAVGIFDKHMKASVVYHDGFKEKEVFSSEIHFYSEQVLDLDLNIDKSKYSLNEDIKFNISLENTGTDEIEIRELQVIFPEGIEVDDADNMETAENGLSWKDDIDKNTTKKFSLTLKGKKLGQSYAQVNVLYEYKDQEYKLENVREEFSLSDQDIQLTTSLSETEEINTEQELYIWLKIWNKNEFAELKNVTTSVDTTLARFENNTLKSVGANDTVFLLNTKMIVPEVDTKTSYPVTFSVTYHTEDGTSYSEELKRTVVVNPFDLVTISQSLSSGSVEEGDSSTVTVDLKNPTDKDIEIVSLTTDIPKIFRVKGATAASTRINKSSTVEIVDFTLTPNIVEKEMKYEIKFIISYELEGYTYTNTETQEITVKPRKPEIKIDKKLSKSKVYEGEIFSVDYVITNNDDVSVYNMTLVTTQDQNFDTIDLFEYNIGRLDPGEKITFDGEQLRAKKIGVLKIADSEIFYTDKHSREFTEISNTPGITVEEDIVTGQALSVASSGPDKAGINEIFEITINLTSIGTQPVETAIDGRTVKIEDTYLVTREIIYDENGTYTIDLPFYEYGYLGQDIRAFSNELSIEILSEEKETVLPGANETGEKVIEEQQEGKKGFFSGLFTWFKKFLGIGY